MSIPLLEICNLKVDIPLPNGMLHPVRRVDLELNRGETLAIVGESGCGKSLTALATMGLLPRSARPTVGRHVFDGMDLGTATDRQWRRLRGNRVSMIFQDPMTALDPCYTIGNQMCEILRQHRRISRRGARARSRDLLRRVGIPSPEDRLKQYPHQLSGGLRQRVVIAMALLCEPDLIIADEPTTALDVTIQAQILRLLKDLQEEMGVGLIIITHDLGVVAGIADRIMVMYGGEVVERGYCDQILSAPLHPYTEGLLQSLPRPGETRPGDDLGYIPGIVPRQTGLLDGCGFAGRCPYVMPVCTEAAVPMRDVAMSGDAPHEMRCVLEADATKRDPEKWKRLAEETE
jgi:peptide/nickel transport system ATP-binding protein